jgi:tRNA G37 N-methylase Trm5
LDKPHAVTEQGIRQSFDFTRVMFSRCNVTEKIRFYSQLVQPNEVVLDTFAGIGYFTLPAVIHGRASHVFCYELNDDALQALRYSLRDNGVHDSAFFWQEIVESFYLRRQRSLSHRLGMDGAIT